MTEETALSDSLIRKSEESQCPTSHTEEHPEGD